MRQPQSRRSSRAMPMRQPPITSEREEEAQGRGGLDPARVEAALAVRRVLGHVGCRAAVLAAERQALQQAQRNQNDRRHHADRRVGRQQADGGGREAHDQDGDEEGVLASDQVADAAEDQGAERTDQEAGRVGGEGRQQRGRVVALGKNSAAKNGASVA